MRGWSLALVVGALVLVRASAQNAPRGAAAEKPVVMPKYEVFASDLDLSPDQQVDRLDPATRLIVYDVGNRVPTGEILTAFSREQLEAEYRPTYATIDDFAAGVKHEGWTVIEKRELKDFFVIVMKTRSGHVVGVYYARTPAGVGIQRAAKIRLFVSDRHHHQIVPDTDVYALSQKVSYVAATSSVGAAGLIPMNYAPTGQNASSLAATVGAVSVHEGELFMMPKRLDDFHFVFAAGADRANAVELAFTGWHQLADDEAPEGFIRVPVKR